MSSIAPSASQEISKKAKEQGVIMLDAPVSGGQPKAVKGTLAIMVGGTQDVFEEVKDIMGESIIRVGEIGSGNTTKLANQIIVAPFNSMKSLPKQR
jgi:2-hydroxy-3-oxopropionate reductase